MSTKEESNGDKLRQPKKQMDNVKEDKETRKFPTTYDHHTKQNRVEMCDSGSSLIVIFKMMEERKEGLDNSKTCCLYGP